MEELLRRSRRHPSSGLPALALPLTRSRERRRHDRDPAFRSASAPRQHFRAPYPSPREAPPPRPAGAHRCGAARPARRLGYRRAECHPDRPGARAPASRGAVRVVHRALAHGGGHRAGTGGRARRRVRARPPGARAARLDHPDPRAGGRAAARGRAAPSPARALRGAAAERPARAAGAGDGIHRQSSIRPPASSSSTTTRAATPSPARRTCRSPSGSSRSGIWWGSGSWITSLWPHAAS